MKLNLCRSNHSACDTSPSIAGGLAQLVSAQTQIIGIGVHYNSASHNVVSPRQGDQRVNDADLKNRKQKLVVVHRLRGKTSFY